MLHEELPVGAFLSAFLVLIPLPWHWRARNVATLSIIAWLFASNVVYGINSIIWADNVDIIAQPWCDITTKFQIGATMALPACCLCLCIHLERIASIRHVQVTHSQKRRYMIFDIAMCWGLPIIYMALHYVVQGHRYDIVEYFGCRPTVYTSIPSIFLIWIFPLIVVVLTSIYAALSLLHFFRRRAAFAMHLRDSKSALNTSRYLRLMAMAIVQMFWGLAVMGINMWFTCRAGLRPWTGWADVHFNFSRVDVFPALFIPPSILRWTFFIWWTIPISSILFFAFFSFGRDAVNEYKACASSLRRLLLPSRKRTALANSSRLPPIKLSQDSNSQSTTHMSKDSWSFDRSSKTTPDTYTFSIASSDITAVQPSPPPVYNSECAV